MVSPIASPLAAGANQQERAGQNSSASAQKQAAAAATQAGDGASSSTGDNKDPVDPAAAYDLRNDKHVGQYALRKLYHESSRPIVVMYTAPSCGPCRALKPTIHAVLDEFKGRVHFVEINIVEDQEIAEGAGVTGTPTIQLFREKERLHHLPGVKSRSSYRDIITEALGTAGGAGQEERRPVKEKVLV